jgi:hypothetical protein
MSAGEIQSVQPAGWSAWRRRRPYAFVVGALAALLIGVVFIRALPVTYLARAEVWREAPASPEDPKLAGPADLDLSAALPTSAVVDILHQLGLEASATQATRLRSALAVRSVDGSRLLLELHADDPHHAAELVTQLAWEIADFQNGVLADERHNEYVLRQAALIEAARQLEQARERCEPLLDLPDSGSPDAAAEGSDVPGPVLGAARDASSDSSDPQDASHSMTRSDTASPDPSTAAADPVFGVPPSDSQRDELNRQLGQLQQQRDRLLDRFTEEHPDLRFVNQQIAHVRQRLAELPQPIESPRTPAASPKPPAPPSETAAALQLRQHREALLREREQAERAFRQASEAAAEAWARYQATADGPWSVVEAAAAHPSQQSADRTSRAVLAVVLALVAGVALAVTSTGLRPAFESADEVRTALRLPVVARIAADRPPARRPAWGRRAVRVAEWVAAAAAMLHVAWWLGGKWWTLG